MTATGAASRTVTASRPASLVLMIAAVGLAAVGVTMNGWFARSLGSSDIAGWLFLAVGVGADLVALAPSRHPPPQLWQAHQRASQGLMASAISIASACWRFGESTRLTIDAAGQARGRAAAQRIADKGVPE